LISDPGRDGGLEWSKLQISVAPPCMAFYAEISASRRLGADSRRESLGRDY
jgi:hypothetical protein